ncbi:TrgA family protein [Pseudorhodobacter sp. MZDSW-24AT]|uniref:TrgA family protein n=1 Tax=Pseudorhodobacter sp. MZDSW-24AT TaxID=2052957 RepID=UPI000C1EBC88|nr:TrgA family protein [Pseudorhodobacter sp. MZDSW-24AT]PJF10520.1 tellurium resistance protein [Pseudorhodobacter sp. MZDSW-24AT]
MPTAAKLVAAFAFALVSAIAVHVYAQSLSEAQPLETLYLVSIAVGVLCGWRIMGGAAKRARGGVEAMATGVRTTLTIVVSVVLIFACADMLDRAMRGRYKTPLDAFLGVFEQALALLPSLARPDLVGVLLLGGLVSGAITYAAGRRWP